MQLYTSDKFPVSLWSNNSVWDAESLIQSIWIDKEYTKVKDIEQNFVVADLGATYGEFAQYALLKGAGFVYNIEMDTELCHCIAANMEKFNPDFYDILELEVNKQNMEWFVGHLQENDVSVDFWKIDVEGAEYDMLDSDIVFDYILNRSSAVVLEFHYIRGGHYFRAGLPRLTEPSEIVLEKGKYDDFMKIANRFKSHGWTVNVFSVDGYNITQNLMEDRIMNTYKGVHKASEFYTEIIVHFTK